MAKLNNLSFYLRDYSIDSNVGNYGVKIAGSDKNVVLNLGKAVGGLSVTALCENRTDYANLKKEFNEGELSTIELNDDIRYYVYPDAIAIRRTAGDPLLGDYTDWRVAEMSFLLPDPIVYGDENCTNFNITGDSPTEEALKNISISSFEETPLSISFQNYNTTKYQITGTMGAGWLSFGQPTYLGLPSNADIKVYGLAITNNVSAGCCVRFGEDCPSPINSTLNACGFSWNELSISTNLDFLDGTTFNIDNYVFDNMDLDACGGYGSSLATIKIEINKSNTEDIIIYHKGSVKWDDGLGPPESSSKGNIYTWDGNQWDSIAAHDEGGGVRRTEISATDYVIQDDKLILLLQFYKNWGFWGDMPLNMFGWLEFLRIKANRYSTLCFKVPTENLPTTSWLRANISNLNPSVGGTVYIDAYESDAQFNRMGSRLERTTLAVSDLGNDLFIPLYVNTENIDRIMFEFKSEQVDNASYTDYLNSSDCSHFKINAGASSESLGTSVKGKHSWEPYDFLEEQTYSEYTDIIFSSLHSFASLSNFQYWNKKDATLKFNISGFLIGEYNAHYLENLSYRFNDTYSNSDLVASYKNATVENNYLHINESGYVMYYLGFGISLIDDPYLTLNYADAPSKIEILDDSDEYSITIPPDGERSLIYNSEFSLVTRDELQLRIWGEANISSLLIESAGSAYLFSLPYIDNGNNTISYSISGVYNNISGELCWREVIG